MEIIKGKTSTPWKVCLYGVPGVGKTTLASLAPSPLIVDLEDGCRHVDCWKTPYIKTWAELQEAFKLASKSDRKTIVFDTADGIEKILTAKVLTETIDEKTGKYRKNLADFGYQRGFEVLAANWALIINWFEKLQSYGKNVVLVAHEKVEKFDSPDSENYGRWQLAVHKKCVPIIVQRMDAVFFMKWQAYVKAKNEKDFQGQSKQRAIGDGVRLIMAEERPCWVAKNRFNMGDKIVVRHDFWKHLGGSDDKEQDAMGRVRSRDDGRSDGATANDGDDSGHREESGGAVKEDRAVEYQVATDQGKGIEQ